MSATQLTIAGISVEVERKNIKHLHLAVYPPDGRVHLSAPMGVLDEQLNLYLLQKLTWIKEKRLARMRYARQLPREYVSGEEHFWRGQSYRLKVEQDVVHSHVEADGDYLKLFVRGADSIEKRATILEDWYRTDLKNLLAGIVAKWEKTLAVKLVRWQIVKMPSRWGSCNPATLTARFNLELAKKPVACVEYVVVHELTHLLERNHTARFEQLLCKHLPAWREIRKQLNEFPISDGTVFGGNQSV